MLHGSRTDRARAARPARRPGTGLLAALLGAVIAAGATAACSGGGEPEGERLPADPAAIVAASAAAMGDVTSVRFMLTRSGAPVYIDAFDSLALQSVDGRFAAPASADAVLTVEVDGSLTTRLGAVAVDDDVWLSNPVTGVFEPLPDGYDLDPSAFFDPRGGWRPLLAGLRDVELLGEDDRGGARYHVRGVAPADRVEVISAGLVQDEDVAMDLWVHPVSGLVTAAEFTTTFGGAATSWTLELRDYGDTFRIAPPPVDG